MMRWALFLCILTREPHVSGPRRTARPDCVSPQLHWSRQLGAVAATPLQLLDRRGLPSTPWQRPRLFRCSKRRPTLSRPIPLDAGRRPRPLKDVRTAAVATARSGGPQTPHPRGRRGITPGQKSSLVQGPPLTTAAEKCHKVGINESDPDICGKRRQ
jgi:hypothetical protein